MGNFEKGRWVKDDTMINKCRQGCQNNEYIDRNWVCTAIDWAEDNEPGFVVQKFKLIDMSKPTPKWCPLEENK